MQLEKIRIKLSKEYKKINFKKIKNISLDPIKIKKTTFNSSKSFLNEENIFLETNNIFLTGQKESHEIFETICKESFEIFKLKNINFKNGKYFIKCKKENLKIGKYDLESNKGFSISGYIFLDKNKITIDEDIINLECGDILFILSNVAHFIHEDFNGFVFNISRSNTIKWSYRNQWIPILKGIDI